MKTLYLLILLSTAIFANIKSFDSFSAEFNQAITNGEKQTISYSGVLYIKNQNMALWKYKKPIDKSIYIKDGSVVVIDRDLEQVIFSKLEKNLNIVELLKEAKEITSNHLQKEQDGVIYNMFLENGELRRVEYIDSLENITVIKFLNVELNKLHDDSIFTPTIPRDYDVIKK